MEEKISNITVKLALQDYRNFAKLSSEKWRTGFYGFAISAIIGNIIVKDISGLIYLLMVFSFYEIWGRASIKRHFESNKLANKEELFNFTEYGVEIIKVDGSGNSKIKWDELYGVKQRKDTIFLMTGKSSGYIIPRRLLNAVQIAEIEALIQNKLGSKIFKKMNYLKWGGIGVLVHIITIFLSGAINVIWDRF
jgi:hypothetical protein